jgi:hypothetical protein
MIPAVTMMVYIIVMGIISYGAGQVIPHVDDTWGPDLALGYANPLLQHDHRRRERLCALAELLRLGLALLQSQEFMLGGLLDP